MGMPCYKREVGPTLKYGEQAERMTLWALMNCPSALRVTSTNDSSSKRLSKTEKRVDLWLFHFRQNCCSVPISWLEGCFFPWDEFWLVPGWFHPFLYWRHLQQFLRMYLEGGLEFWGKSFSTYFFSGGGVCGADGLGAPTRMRSQILGRFFASFHWGRRDNYSSPFSVAVTEWMLKGWLFALCWATKSSEGRTGGHTIWLWAAARYVCNTNRSTARFSRMGKKELLINYVCSKKSRRGGVVRTYYFPCLLDLSECLLQETLALML